MFVTHNQVWVNREAIRGQYWQARALLSLCKSYAIGVGNVNLEALERFSECRVRPAVQPLYRSALPSDSLPSPLVSTRSISAFMPAFWLSSFSPPLMPSWPMSIL